MYVQASAAYRYKLPPVHAAMSTVWLRRGTVHGPSGCDPLRPSVNTRSNTTRKKEYTKAIQERARSRQGRRYLSPLSAKSRKEEEKNMPPVWYSRVAGHSGTGLYREPVLLISCDSMSFVYFSRLRMSGRLSPTTDDSEWCDRVPSLFTYVIWLVLDSTIAVWSKKLICRTTGEYTTTARRLQCTAHSDT